MRETRLQGILRRSARPHRSGGVTLIELVSVTAIILLLAGLAVPVAHTTLKRQKELELRHALREIRTAIDNFQIDAERIPGIRQQLNTVNEELYPEDLEILVEGVDIGDAAGTRMKYLRRIPRDPFTGKREWKTRSSRDMPNSLFTDGTNVFDVRSESDALALDGKTHYNEW